MRTWMMVGSGTETAPTTSKTIGGATITVMNGPEAGWSTTSDANGAFQLMLNKQSRWTPRVGQITVRIQAANYPERSVSIPLTHKGNVMVELDPVFQMVSTTLRKETVVSSDETCPGWWDYDRYLSIS